MTKLRANLLLVERIHDSSEKKTASGIILPNTVVLKDVPLRGVVKETGRETKSIPMECKVGETIVYKRDSVITEVNGMDLVSQESVVLIEKEACHE